MNYNGFYNDLLAKAQTGLEAGQSVDDVVSAYAVPTQYGDFQATEERLRATVQYIFEGR